MHSPELIAAEHASIASRRLVGRTVRVSSLDETAIKRLFSLFQDAYEGADWNRFVRDLSAKQLIIVMADRGSRELMGFSTVEVASVRMGWRRAIVVFSGDTVIDRAYWGQKVLYQQFSQVLLRNKMRRPWRPVLWLLLSKGYKTYLIMQSTCPINVPRYDRSDAMGLRAIASKMAAERFGNRFDSDTGIVTATDTERVRPGVAPVDATALQNPHVRFFVERNPGYANGDELVCSARIRFRDMGMTWLRALMRRRHSR